MKVLFLLGALLLSSMPLHAEDAYPNRTIEIIVPAAAGGPNDVVARLFADHLRTVLKVPVVAVNRTGAGTTVGTVAVANAAPDGYTLLVTADSFAANPSIYPNVHYDPVRDFTPISLLASAPEVLVVRRDLPVNTLTEFISLAKQGSLQFASGGTGTLSHLTNVLFHEATGTTAVHIPYKGASPALTDLLGGHVDAMWVALAPAVQYAASGQLKALAVSTRTRSPSLPDVPTAAEAGLPGFEVSTWQGLLAPAKTPQPVIAKLADAADQIFHRPEVRKALSDIGSEAVGSGPDPMAEEIRKGLAKWPDVAKKAGIAF